MAVIAHNITAMNAQRQYGINSNIKAKTTEKLASGYRINRAADDAAGLAISEKMRAQIRGLTKGVQNTEDGISLCHVADGALNEVSNMLHRMKELAVQSANGTNTDDDRENLQDEVSQLLEEIDRISEDTEFNTLRIFQENNRQKLYSNSSNETSENLTSSSVSFIRDSISISGSPQNLNNGTYQILAEENGISINNAIIGWDNVLDENGNAFDLNNIRDGNYSLEYNGINIEFQTRTGATTTEVLSAISNTFFDVVSSTTSFQAVNLQSYGLTQGTETDRFLSSNGTRYRYSGGYEIKADESGIHVSGKYVTNEFSTISWSSLGISDLENAGGKTINFQDSESGVHFTATISDGATKQEILDSFNKSTFYWGYIDMSTKENARLGYSASSLTTTITNTATAPVKARAVSVNKIGDELFDKLGYTSLSDKLNGLNLEISISGSTKDDLKVTLKDTATGNTTDLMLYSWDPAIYHYANPSGNATAVFGYNAGAQIRLNMSYSTVNVPADADAISYLGTLGTIATDVVIPSPYYFKYKIGGVDQTEYTVENVVKNNQTLPNTSDNSDNEDVLEEELNLWIQSGANEGQGMWLTINNMSTIILGLSEMDISTFDGATKALGQVREALAKVSKSRSKIGAQQNRLEHTVDRENVSIENLTASESRIRDADMAYELVQNSKFEILQQTGQSMLAQANHSLDSILSLLQQ